MNALLIDIGNTRLKWGLWQNGVKSAFGSLATADIDAASICVQLEKVAQVDRIVMACVAGDEPMTCLQSILEERFSCRPEQVAVSQSIGRFYNAYLNPHQLGVDRWLAAIGARRLAGQGDLIIVDMGTATTIDWLDSNNTFRGGVIMPGPALMHRALVGETAEIECHLASFDRIIGQSTDQCVNSGVYLSCIGGVEYAIDRIRQSLPGPVKILLTGGAYEYLVKALAEAKTQASDEGLFAADIIEPDLVLLGLLSIVEDKLN